MPSHPARRAPIAAFSLLLLLLLVSCSMARPEADALRQVDDGEAFLLSPGERVSLAGQGTLRYVDVVADSRCPVDVQCVWAGVAEVAFEWRPPAGNAQAFSLKTDDGDDSRLLDRRRLTLQALSRDAAPQARLLVEPAAP